jgi:hypothetical protein
LFQPAPNYFVALPAKKYSRRPGLDLCRANPRMQMTLSLLTSAICAIARIEILNDHCASDQEAER